MFRLVHFIRRKPELSVQAFRDHWLNQQGPLVARHAPALGIRRYVQTHVLHDDPLGQLLQSTYGTSTDLFDGLTEVWLTDPGRAAKCFDSPAGKRAAQELLDNEREFIDLSRSIMWFGIEAPQINPLGWTVATPTSSIVKWLAPLWKLPEMGLAETRSHWLANHGPLVRELTSAVPMLRYVQIHRFDHPFADELNAARGGLQEPVYGHAELWLDRHALAAAAGPEVDEAFGLFVEDCKLFIDLAASPFMVGKEHVLVDRRLVERPLPTPRSMLW
jgi:hypothetical protein